jgi:hypothetical protein
MADAFLGLTELAQLNDKNVLDLDISDLLDEAPVLAALAAQPTDGNTHKYLKQTGAPSVGFRSVNDGRENTKSADTEVTVTLKLLDCSYVVDKAIADQFRGGPEAYIAREGLRHLKEGFSHAEQTVFGGTGFDANGYAGLADDAALDGLADEMVLDGLGAGVNLQTSVWAIKTGIDQRDMSLISGLEGEIKIVETITQFFDGANGRYPVYATPIYSWLGVQIGGARSVARLANIDTVATLDDDKISSLLALFPANKGPTFLAMTRASRQQLQASRTATSTTGAPAPFPESAFGIPIITTDSLTATEAVVA